MGIALGELHDLMFLWIIEIYDLVPGILKEWDEDLEGNLRTALSQCIFPSKQYWEWCFLSSPISMAE